MEYTEKKDQRITLRQFVDEWVKDFENRYKTIKIGNHHYIRRRHLQNFLYDYTNISLKKIKSDIIIFD